MCTCQSKKLTKKNPGLNFTWQNYLLVWKLALNVLLNLVQIICIKETRLQGHSLWHLYCVLWLSTVCFGLKICTLHITVAHAWTQAWINNVDISCKWCDQSLDHRFVTLSINPRMWPSHIWANWLQPVSLKLPSCRLSYSPLCRDCTSSYIQKPAPYEATGLSVMLLVWCML